MMGRRLVICTFVVLAAATAAGAIDAVRRGTADPSLHAWLVSAYALLKTGVAVTFAMLVARRGPALRRTHEPLAFAACAAAILPVVLLRTPAASASAALVIAGELLALLAAAWILAAVLALGTCFGVLPEARGLVTRGPYRVVRHPIYLGEFAVYGGLLMASPRLLNLGGALFFTAGQLVRMRMEERALRAEFPGYVAYAAATPRVLPTLPLSLRPLAKPLEGIGD